MIEIPVDLPPEVVPLSWLLGAWEGSGVLDYTLDEERILAEFDQRVTFEHDGVSAVRYEARAWHHDDPTAPFAEERGYWRLARARTDGDPGPGMLPGEGAAPYRDAEGVETLRNATGGFDVEATIAHPDGVTEFYLGTIVGARVDVATDAVLRAPGAREFSSATRLYGLVQGRLMWAWDIAALGQDLRTHASASLGRVEAAGSGAAPQET